MVKKEVDFFRKKGTISIVFYHKKNLLVCPVSSLGHTGRSTKEKGCCEASLFLYKESMVLKALFVMP